MPAFGTSVTHSLGKQRATEVLQQFLETVRRDYAEQISEMRGEWSDQGLDFAFKTMGMPIHGNLIVGEDQVHVNGKLPLAASFFRGRIEQQIRDELAKLLG
jgi:hypothetical protein